jgi:hypothetical protein
MKKYAIALCALVLASTAASAAPLRGEKLRQAVIKMNLCYAPGVAIQFADKGEAWIITPSAEAAGDNEYSYASASEDSSDDSAYTSDSASAYANPYSFNIEEGSAVKSSWKVRGSKVLVKIGKTWAGVTIGFKSQLCEFN